MTQLLIKLQQNSYSHFPCVQEIIPARSAAQGLLKVLPSQPHTGLYSMVQGPSLIFAGSMQAPDRVTPQAAIHKLTGIAAKINFWLKYFINRWF